MGLDRLFDKPPFSFLHFIQAFCLKKPPEFGAKEPTHNSNTIFLFVFVFFFLLLVGQTWGFSYIFQLLKKFFNFGGLSLILLFFLKLCFMTIEKGKKFLFFAFLGVSWEGPLLKKQKSWHD